MALECPIGHLRLSKHYNIFTAAISLSSYSLSNLYSHPLNMLLPKWLGVFVIEWAIIAWNYRRLVSVVASYQRFDWTASIIEWLNKIQIRCKWSNPVPKTSVINKPIAHLAQELQFDFVSIRPGEQNANTYNNILFCPQKNAVSVRIKMKQAYQNIWKRNGLSCPENIRCIPSWLCWYWSPPGNSLMSCSSITLTRKPISDECSKSKWLKTCWWLEVFRTRSPW